ncbi:SPOR domain-containing protein [Thiomicrorhabdus aquaedulcis]|uniref:SPOR domain-containing protein n=1 Tax=Thiomicrorhabdus aquaedulcis TaxID=2211106 RepID=UPI000FD93E60|nr:SPOR domain-containing protein [Thiomicrorhabdus aquaedulcis]
MARDYRHGHQPKESFQRKSQKTASGDFVSKPPSKPTSKSVPKPTPKPVPRSSSNLAANSTYSRQPIKPRYDNGVGHGGFKNASNQEEPVKRSAAMVWGASFLVSLLLLTGFFVTQHFADFGVKSGTPVDQTIYQEPGQAASTSPSQTALTEVPIETTTVVKALKVEQSKPVNVNHNDILQAPESVAQDVSASALNDSPVESQVSAQASGEMTEEKTTSNSSAEPVADPVLKNHYSFYQGLGQTEVMVDAVPISVKLGDPYYIQGGTFDTLEKARNEQKRLAQHSLNLVVAKFESSKGVYYRLRMGPYSDRLEMNKKRNELRRLGVDTLLIKIPK